MEDEFAKNVLSLKGDIGKKWLDAIPKIIKKYEEKWSLKVLSPFALSYNYVAPAVLCNGAHAVFKIILHGTKQFNAEHDALQLFNGDGVIRLLKADFDDHVLLLERAEPGKPVSELKNDDEATRAIISVMKKLWKPAPVNHNFVSLNDWYMGFERLRNMFGGKTGPLPEKLVTQAQELYIHLIDTSTEQFVLHGDLHHDNVLSATRQPWLAIDPDAVVGERVHETAAMLRNPKAKLLKFANLKKILERRIAILSEELGVARERIRQWGFAQTVLSVIWNIEDNADDWQFELAIAELLSKIKC